MLHHEQLAWLSGRLLIGIDEVGRGPLAGPVVAAAVCFPMDHPGIAGVRDSKKVPRHAERVRLVQVIQSEALAWGLGAASVREIARDNIRRATALAMRRALRRCRARLGDETATTIIVDGLRVPELQADHQALVKGDAVLGLLVVAINILGGIFIGVVQKGMDITKAASRVVRLLFIHFSLVER